MKVKVKSKANRPKEHSAHKSKVVKHRKPLTPAIDPTAQTAHWADGYMTEKELSELQQLEANRGNSLGEDNLDMVDNLNGSPANPLTDDEADDSDSPESVDQDQPF